MPLINFVPTSPAVERRLQGDFQLIRQQLKQTISAEIGFPETDIIVHLLRCPFLDVDPDAAEIEISLDTCPHEPLEAISNDLLRLVGMALVLRGFRDEELWFRFFQGPWLKIVEGEEVDFVEYPRRKNNFDVTKAEGDLPQAPLN